MRVYLVDCLVDNRQQSPVGRGVDAFYVESINNSSIRFTFRELNELESCLDGGVYAMNHGRIMFDKDLYCSSSSSSHRVQTDDGVQ